MLNTKVLEIIRLYPTDGTHQYHWVNGFDGVTRDLVYEGEVIARADAQQRTYCCGLTFEVYLLARDMNLRGMSVAELKRMKSDWFVATGKRAGPVDALVPRGLGIATSLEDARAGDFIQFWRRDGSGHSAIFLGLEDNGIRYWSTQKATNGIGIREEYFTSGKSGLKRDEIYIARAFSELSAKSHIAQT